MRLQLASSPALPASALGLAAGLAFAAALMLRAQPSDAAATRIPPPPVLQAGPAGNQVAVLAGGCFWGIEAVFEHVKGVKSVVVGYAGGTKEQANYRDVSSERTRHAEAVRIVFDPAQVSYGTLLQVFFSVAHDPTQVNRQTPDVGPSYRSAIFPQTDRQRQLAAAYIASLERAHTFARPIATKLESGTFYPAEDWHQDYLRRHPSSAYITRWDKPKLAALKATYPQWWRN